MPVRTPGARLLVAAAFVLGTAAGALAQSGRTSDGPRPATSPSVEPSSAAPASTAYTRSPEQVMASLNRATTWYRQARTVMRSTDTAAVFGYTDEQTAIRLLGRAFDAARAEAELLDREPGAAVERRRASRRGARKARASIRRASRRSRASGAASARPGRNTAGRWNGPSWPRATDSSSTRRASSTSPSSGSSIRRVQVLTTISSIRSRRSGRPSPSSRHRQRPRPSPRRRRREPRRARGR